MANIANCYYLYDNMKFNNTDDLYLGVLSNTEARQSLFSVAKSNQDSTNVTGSVFQKPLPRGKSLEGVTNLFDFEVKQPRNVTISVRRANGVDIEPVKTSFVFTSKQNPDFKIYGVRENNKLKIYSALGYHINSPFGDNFANNKEALEYLNSMQFNDFYNNLPLSSQIKIGARVSQIQEDTVRMIEARLNTVVLDKALNKYVDLHNLNKLDRVSSVLNANKTISNATVDAATAIGTGIDNVNRDVMNDTLLHYADYTTTVGTKLFDTKEAFDTYVAEIQAFKLKLEARGERIVTNGGNEIVLFDKKNGIAGAVDLLTVDVQGKIRIYDYKTMKGDQFTEMYSQEADGNVKYESTLFGDSNRTKHTKQQSFYKALFEDMYGKPVESINIISIELNKYEDSDRSVKRASIYKEHQLTPIEINLGKTRPDVTVESFADFVKTYTPTESDIANAEGILNSPSGDKLSEMHTAEGAFKVKATIPGVAYEIFDQPDNTSRLMSYANFLPLFTASEAFKDKQINAIGEVERGTVNRGLPITVTLPESDEEIEELMKKPVPVRDPSTVNHKTGISYVNKFFTNDRLNPELVPELISQFITESSRQSDKAVLRIFAANPQIFDNIPFVIDYNATSRGFVNINSIGKPINIVINPSLLKDEADARRVLIEEMIHAVVFAELRTNSEFAGRLNKLRDASIDNFGREKFDQMLLDQQELKDLKRLKNLSSLSAEQQSRYDAITNNPEFSAIFYNLSNIDEFVAGSLLSSEFQKYLNGIDINSSSMKEVKSLWKELINIVAEFLNKYIGKTNKTNPVLEYALYDTLNLVENAAQKIAAHPAILDIVGSHRKTLTEVDMMFNLRDEDGNLNRIANQDEVTQFINHNLYNVVAMANEDGTIELIYQNNSVLYTSDVAFNTEEDTEEDDSTMDSKAGFSNRVKSYIINLKARERSIQKSLRQNEYRENMTDEEFDIAYANTLNLEKEITHIRTLIKNVTKKGDINVSNLTMLKEQAVGELEHITEFMNKGMNSADIKYALETTKFWLNAKNMLFDKNDFNDKLMLDSFNDLEAKAKIVDNVILDKLNDWVMDNLVGKYTKNDNTLNNILKEMKDLGRISAEVADLSTINSPILQALSKHIKLKDVELSKKRQDAVREYENVIKNAANTLKSFGSPNNRYEIFRQIDEYGNPTRNMVSRYSNEYQQERKALNFVYGKTDRTANEAFEAYQHYFNNTVKVDLSAIFPLDDATYNEEAHNAEVARVKTIIGENHYNEWYKDQNKKIKAYKKDRLGYMMHMVKQNNLNNISEVPTNLEADRGMGLWEERNSPYKVATDLKNNIVDNPFTLKDGYNNFKYMTDIPAKTKTIEGITKPTAYYDSKFEIIERNPELLAVHDKFQEIMKYVGTLIPYGTAERLANGSIPEFQKSMYDVVDGKPKNFFKAVNEGLVDMVRTEKYENYEEETDIVTGKVKRHIRLGIKRSDADIAKDIYLRELAIYKDTGKQPTDKESALIKSQVTAEYAKDMEFDLAKVFKMYLNLGIAYENKAESEDALNLTEIMMNNQEEYVRNNKGNLVEDTNAASKGYVQYKTKAAEESFLNQKRVLENTINALQYGDKRDINSTKTKVYTKAEKKQKKFLEDQLTWVDEQLASGGLVPEEAAVAKKKIKGYIDQLGAYGDTEKYVDLPIKWTQFVGMGWNVIGGVSNMSFGTAANFIEAAGEEFYTNTELLDAYGKVMHSVLRNSTFNLKTTNEAEKIRSLMDVYDIMAESGKEYTDLIGDDFTARMKFLSAFNVNQRTEYINQAPLMLVMLEKTKFIHEGNEHSLYDAFGIDGQWNTEQFGEYPADLVGDAIIKAKALIQRNHGNYNPLAPMLAKRTGIGRLLLQFRGWMLEGVKVRFGDRNGKTDEILGSSVKGRYWSVVDSYKDAGAVDVTKSMILQVLRNFIPFKNSIGMNKSPIDMFLQGGSIKAVDIANMKRVAYEINILIGAMVIGAIMKYMVGEIDDEDDPRTLALNLLLNQATRLQTDVMMYTNPLEAMKVLQDPVPSMRILSSFVKINNSLYDTIINDTPEYEAGINKGRNKIKTAIMGAFPIGRPIESVYSNVSQSY